MRIWSSLSRRQRLLCVMLFLLTMGLVGKRIAGTRAKKTEHSNAEAQSSVANKSPVQVAEGAQSQKAVAPALAPKNNSVPEKVNDSFSVSEQGVSFAEKLQKISQLRNQASENGLESLLGIDYSLQPRLAAPVIEALTDVTLTLQKKERLEQVSSELLARVSHEENRTGARESSGNIILLLEALQQLKQKSAVQELCQKLETLADPVLQDTVVKTLEGIGAPEGVVCLQKYEDALQLRTAQLQPGTEVQMEYALNHVRKAIGRLGQIKPP